MTSLIDRITEAEAQAQSKKRDASVKAREMVADARTRAAASVSEAAKSASERKNAASANAEIKGEALFKEIFDKNSARADEYCAAAEKKFESAVDHIIKKALEL